MNRAKRRTAFWLWRQTVRDNIDSRDLIDAFGNSLSARSGEFTTSVGRRVIVPIEAIGLCEEITETARLELRSRITGAGDHIWWSVRRQIARLSGVAPEIVCADSRRNQLAWAHAASP